jgi:hypothetical protein
MIYEVDSNDDESREAYDEASETSETINVSTIVSTHLTTIQNQEASQTSRELESSGPKTKKRRQAPEIQKSLVWKYFTKDKESNSATCACSAKFSYPPGGSTSSMMKHTKKCVQCYDV